VRYRTSWLTCPASSIDDKGWLFLPIFSWVFDAGKEPLARAGAADRAQGGHRSACALWRTRGEEAINGSEWNGAYLRPDSAITPMCSLDGAQWNPGIDVVANRFPRISLALHAGYLLRGMRPRCCTLGQGRLSMCHPGRNGHSVSFREKDTASKDRGVRPRREQAVENEGRCCAAWPSPQPSANAPGVALPPASMQSSPAGRGRKTVSRGQTPLLCE
jgi:hypothetical protein